jgi:hypothetical protein
LLRDSGDFAGATKNDTTPSVVDYWEKCIPAILKGYVVFVAGVDDMVSREPRAL